MGSACTDRELAGMVHVRNRGMRWLGLALGALLILSACSAQGGEPVSVTTPSDSVSSTAPPDEPSSPSTGKPSHNDLRTGHLTRSLKAGDVKLTVEYSLRNRVERWSPGVDQPLTVSMTTARQLGQAPTDQKIYLSRVTADLEVSDVTGHLDSPDALVDKADISPGFLVTSPSSYTEVFVLPSLPDEATRLTIDFRYELLIPQPQSNLSGFREANCHRHCRHLEAVAPNCFDLDRSRGSFSSRPLFRAQLMSCAPGESLARAASEVSGVVGRCTATSECTAKADGWCGDDFVATGRCLRASARIVRER